MGRDFLPSVCLKQFFVLLAQKHLIEIVSGMIQYAHSYIGITIQKTCVNGWGGTGKMSWWLRRSCTAKLTIDKESAFLNVLDAIQWYIFLDVVCTLILGYLCCTVHQDFSRLLERGQWALQGDLLKVSHHLLSGNGEGNIADLQGVFACGCWMIQTLPSDASSHSSSCSEPEGAWAKGNMMLRLFWVSWN